MVYTVYCLTIVNNYDEVAKNGPKLFTYKFLPNLKDLVEICQKRQIVYSPNMILLEAISNFNFQHRPAEIKDIKLFLQNRMGYQNNHALTPNRIVLLNTDNSVCQFLRTQFAEFKLLQADNLQSFISYLHTAAKR